MNDETLNVWRYYFQRILVPCVVIIGVLGNCVNVIVLTRRRMRCSTNVYLTALAVSDIVFLVFVFIFSLQHYPNWHSIKHGLYWRTYGLSHWFCDAAAYTSIYLTVSFTIERYIVVCHPFRGQIYIKNSTKNAKRVISVVVIFCFLSTITTALEYQLDVQTKYYDRMTGELCPNYTEPVLTTENVNNNNSICVDECFVETPIDMEFEMEAENVSTTEPLPCTTDVIEDISLYVIPSALGASVTYQKSFFLFSTVVFIFLPLILLGTFNCFLVAAVRRSHKMRHKMTNTRNTSTTMSSQENKITTILIAVVVLFLICQTPSAVNLVYVSWFDAPSDPESLNLQKALGNLMNFLITLNAACNFILYCALSDKYRQTIKALLLGKWNQRQNTLNSTQISRLSMKGNTTRGSVYELESNPATKKQPDRLKRISTLPAQTTRPTVKIDRNRASFSAPHNHQPYTPDDTLKESNGSSENASIQLRISSIGTPQPSINNSPGIHSFDSQTSLTRSQSLIFKPPVKHAPDCKSHPDNLPNGD